MRTPKTQTKRLLEARLAARSFLHVEARGRARDGRLGRWPVGPSGTLAGCSAQDAARSAPNRQDGRW